jgi:hypothetical protein
MMQFIITYICIIKTVPDNLHNTLYLLFLLTLILKYREIDTIRYDLFETLTFLATFI